MPSSSFFLPPIFAIFEEHEREREREKPRSYLTSLQFRRCIQLHERTPTFKVGSVEYEHFRRPFQTSCRVPFQTSSFSARGKRVKLCQERRGESFHLSRLSIVLRSVFSPIFFQISASFSINSNTRHDVYC